MVQSRLTIASQLRGVTLIIQELSFFHLLISLLGLLKQNTTDFMI